ncbi:nitrogen regulation protein NR(II) [Desulforhopalus sp. IMCC35007]|uniref:two-component system sensor histidine kinase NtrB n=1 Tax=Desulforhopalus sp. IMCC35007 TaxID=2569543 RepID=UPI00197A791C|nr:ATP-binding protein [Desulforhopalus sp. IMCC35007]
MINTLSRFFHRLRFKTKLILGMTFMLVFCGLGVGLILSAMSSNALLEEGRKRGMALTSSLAFQLTEPILALDFLHMKNLIDNVHNQYDDIIYIFLTDDNSNILSHTFSGGFPTDLLNVNVDNLKPQPILLSTEQGLVYDFNVQVHLGEKNLGFARLGLSRKKIDTQINRQRLTSLLSTMGVVGLGIILALWFARTVTLRLDRLRKSVGEIIRGNLNVQAGFPLEKYCWQIMQCNHTDCPAYGDVQRRCWYLAGTMCPNCGDKQYPFKMENCRQCPVFKHNFGDELQDLAEAFDAMAVTVKNDIEELTEREKTIARQEGLLKSIMNGTPDFVTLQDTNLKYTFAGKAFCNYFNMDEKEIIGKTDWDIFTQQQAQINTDENKQILATGVPLAKQITFKRANEQKWFHVVKVPVYDQDGSIMGLLLTSRDISMIKKFQEQLIQSQKMEDLGRLAGGVAHEINTPLGIILGYSQLMMDDIEDEELLEGMRIIEKQTKVCRKIVADLLGFSRSSVEVVGTIDINKSVQEVIRLVEHAFFMNRIKIISTLDTNIPLLPGDQERLKQVWLNLMNNAADVIEQDGVIQVQTRLVASEQKIIVSVADSGKGIAQQHLNIIFDPFFTTKQVGKGTGLGLSVSFGIIKDHGGKISALSPVPEDYLTKELLACDNAGPGAVFVVELPLSIDDTTKETDKTDGAH